VRDRLSPMEQNELERYECLIEEGLRSFIEVGHAFMAIREKGLYRAKAESFEEYYQRYTEKANRYALRGAPAQNYKRPIPKILDLWA
jgi:hypothetical protein